MDDHQVKVQKDFLDSLEQELEIRIPMILRSVGKEVTWASIASIKLIVVKRLIDSILS